MEPDNPGSSTLLSIANKRTRMAKADTEACNNAWYERSLELHKRINDGIVSLANANERVERAKREERMTWDAAENSHRCRENVEALLTAANERADRWELAATNANGRARRFYKPDGSFEMLDSEVSVTLRRIEYARRLHDAESTLADHNVKAERMNEIDKTVYATGKVLETMTRDEVTKRLVLTDQGMKVISPRIWNTFAEAYQKIKVAKDDEARAQRVAAEAEWDSENERL